MAEASSPKTITLKAADGNVVKLEPSIAKEMRTVQAFIDADDEAAADVTSAVVIPLPEVDSRELVRIIECCRQHRAGKFKDSTDPEFTKALGNDELMELLLAAHYLDMKDLFEFLSECIADRIQNKSVEYGRKLFRVTDSGYTPEEEAELRGRPENAWAFNDVDPDDD